MSRHGKFYRELRWGNYDDYDDDDDYEEGDPEDEGYLEERDAPRGGCSERDAHGVDVKAVDYDVLGPTVARVVALVSSNIDAVVDAARQSNYDVDQTVARLRGGQGAASKAAPPPAARTDVAPPALDPSLPKTSPASRPQTQPATSPQGNKASRTVAPPVGALRAADSEGKTPFMVVMAGHVDCGKSTILGHLLLCLGIVKSSEVASYERLGMARGKASFKFAWLLDQSEEERRRGITIDTTLFEMCTDRFRVYVFDAPGHKDFVGNMIPSAAMADAALMVVAAGAEFESGLLHGTREHLVVLWTLGIGSVILVLNKMDLIEYSETRVDHITNTIAALMRDVGFADGALVAVVPVCGIDGTNLTTPMGARAVWYRGPTLIGAIDALPPCVRVTDAPLRLVVHDVVKSTVTARVHSGRLERGAKLEVNPGSVRTTVTSVSLSSGAKEALAGDVVNFNVGDAVGIVAGAVGSKAQQPLGAVSTFTAEVRTFPSLPLSILPGTVFVLSVHSATVEAVVTRLLGVRAVDGSWQRGLIKCVPSGVTASMELRVATPIVVEASGVRALSRFVLRYDGDTVAGGVVTAIG